MEGTPLINSHIFPANVAVFIGISIVFYYSLSDLPSDIPRTTPVKMDWTKFPEFYGE
jgi:hypothetical protein